MSTEAYLGQALINIASLKNIKRRYYPLAPSNLNVIEVELVHNKNKL